MPTTGCEDRGKRGEGEARLELTEILIVNWLKSPIILANQFRALEEDEVVFLDSMKADRDQAERKRKMEDDEEVEGFKA